MQPAHPFFGDRLEPVFQLFTHLLASYHHAGLGGEKGKKRAGIKTQCHLALERDSSWVREAGSRQKVRNVAYSSEHWKPTTKQRYHLRNYRVTAEGQSYRLNNIGEGQAANAYKDTLSCFIHSLCQRALQQKRLCGFIWKRDKTVNQY